VAGHKRAALASEDIRDHNLGIVLATLDRGGAAARAELASATGMARSALSNLSTVLLEHALVRASAERADRGLGRPLERLEIDGAHIVLAGVYLQVDAIVTLAVDLAGRVRYEERVDAPTPPGDPTPVVEQLAGAVTRCRTALAAEGVAVRSLDLVVAGVVPRGSDIVQYALDFGWMGVALRSLVQERVEPFPDGIRLAGDTQYAAFAEFTALKAQDAAADLESIVYIRSATGIGGAVIADGKIFGGANGTVFTPGHTIVDPHGALCECGRRGCLVTVADPELIVDHAGLHDLRRAAGLPAALAEFIARVRAGDAHASAALEDALLWIRMIVDNAIMMYAPQAVVLGGYLAEVCDRIRGLHGTTLDVLGVGGLRGQQAIVPARLGDSAPLQGALTLRRRALLAAPGRSGLLG